jgi:NADPH-dependent F420 reductase
MADVVVLSVPYEGQLDVLADVRSALADKIVVSVVVPLRPPQVSRVHAPEGGSAAREAQAFLGADARVVAAFHNVAAARLADLDADVGCDVLVCGDDPSAKQLVMDLVADARATGFDAGPLANASVPEGLTSVLIGINRRYGSHDAGMRITNVKPK